MIWARVEGVSGARIAAEAALVGVLALLCLWPFRLYGFDLVDEGTQLVQIERVVQGERPYRDFETGYTPGYFGLHAMLWRTSGLELVATRTFGVGLHALSVALTYAAVRFWCGGLLAVSAAAVYVAFLLPVSLRSGAPFNVPYPGWLAAPFALVAQVAVARVAEGAAARGLWTLAAGIAGGLAFSVKPNAGLLVVGGAALAMAPSWDAGSRLARGLATLLRGVAALSVVLLLWPGLSASYAIALLLPAWLTVARCAPAGSAESSSGFRDLTWLSIGFALVALPWLLPLLGELGAAGIARDVLLLAGGVVEAYLIPFPWPEPAAIALLAGLVGAAWLLHGARGHLAPWAVLAGLVLCALLAIPMGARRAAESVVLWLGPTSLLIGLTALPSAGVRAALAFASFYQLSLFPRPDLVHVSMAGPSLVLAAALVWRHHADLWWKMLGMSGQQASGTRAALGAVSIVLVLCLGRMLPALGPRLGGHSVPLEVGDRAPLVILEPYAAEHRWIGEAVHEIERRAAPGEAIVAFPDVAGIGFLARRPQPYHHLYFVPGRPDREGERRTLDRLEEVKPRIAISCSPSVPAFRGAMEYFSDLRSYLATHYDLATTLGPCEVRARKAQAARAPHEVAS